MEALTMPSTWSLMNGVWSEGPTSRSGGCAHTGELLSRQGGKGITVGHGQQSLEGSRLLIFTTPRPLSSLLPPGKLGPESQLIEVTDRTCSFPLSERPKCPCWAAVVKSLEDCMHPCKEAGGGKWARPDSCANFTVIPESHICLPKALHLQHPTLNRREKQNTKAIFSAGSGRGTSRRERDEGPVLCEDPATATGSLLLEKGQSVYCSET